MPREVNVASLDDIAEEGVHSVEIGHLRIAIVRGSAQLYAVQDRCPHKGARLSEGKISVERDEIICPWHRFRFRCADGISATNAMTKIRTFPLRIERDQILITIP